MALSRRTGSTRVLVVSLVMVSLLTITLDYRGRGSGPFEAAERGALAVIGPLQTAVSRVLHPIGAFFVGLTRIGSLQDENRVLRERVEELERERQTVVSVRRRARELEDTLKVKKQLELRGVTANVIGQSVGNFEWSVTVDRGSSDGVRPDMPVVSGEGLVGHVVQVSSGWSKVQLIIDPRSGVASRLSHSGEIGILQGRRNQDLAMDLVNPEAEVLPEEQVVTSGYSVGRQEGLYPAGIIVGFVSHVYSDPGSLTKLVGVRPAVDFSSLEYVLVVKDRKTHSG